MKRDNLELESIKSKINEAVKYFRAGEESAGNMALSDIFDKFLKMMESSQKELPPPLMEKFVEIHSEMDNQNYIRIADILEFELLDKL
tara:strand:- start:36 stop:299 length:264 start_codon:yes stop_codon:yes gene_type:complete